MNKFKKIIFINIIIGSIILINVKSTYAYTLTYNHKEMEVEEYTKELKQVRREIEVLEAKLNKREVATDINESSNKIVTVSMVELDNKQELTDNKEYQESKLQELIIEEVKMIKYIEQEVEEKLTKTNSKYEKGIWPIEDYTDISSPYGERIHPISGKHSFHKGIDIPAPQGTDILSTDNGIVIFSGQQNGYGNVVKIKHFDGRVSVYAHNNENIVNEEDIVLKGEAIAKVGTTGNSTGNHLHFEIQVDEETINPKDGVYVEMKTEDY